MSRIGVTQCQQTLLPAEALGGPSLPLPASDSHQPSVTSLAVAATLWSLPPSPHGLCSVKSPSTSLSPAHMGQCEAPPKGSRRAPPSRPLTTSAKSLLAVTGDTPRVWGRGLGQLLRGLALLGRSHLSSMTLPGTSVPGNEPRSPPCPRPSFWGRGRGTVLLTVSFHRERKLSFKESPVCCTPTSLTITPAPVGARSPHSLRLINSPP